MYARKPDSLHAMLYACYVLFGIYTSTDRLLSEHFMFYVIAAR